MLRPYPSRSALSALVLFAAAGGCTLVTSLDGLQGTGTATDGGAGDSTSDALLDAPGDAPRDGGPDVVLPPSSAVDIAVGGQLSSHANGHACAIVGAERSVWCWGAGTDGQLGGGDFTDKSTPTKIIADSASQAFNGVDQLALGSYSSCGRKSGFPFCWGLRQAGTVGDIVSANALATPKPSIGVVTQIASGGAVACGIKTDNALHCWGDDSLFQLGVNPNTLGACPSFFSPNGRCSAAQIQNTKVPAPLVAVSVGSSNVCVLSPSGQVQCWGSNQGGVSGNDGNFVIFSDSAPITVKVGPSTMLDGVAQIASGGLTVCAIRADKSLWCWGLNDTGQLGSPIPDGGGGSAYALKVAGVQAAMSVGVGDHATCVVNAAAEVQCWGDDTYGQLGDGAKTVSAVPVTVKGPGGVGKLSGVSKVAVAYGFACALTFDKSVYCWGHNDHGQLGDGTTIDRPYPVRVIGLP